MAEGATFGKFKVQFTDVESYRRHNGLSGSLENLENWETISPPFNPPSPKSSMTEVYKEAARHQTTRIAEAALKYYNKKHHTDFKLVDPVGSNCRHLLDGFWSHCNFTAKPEAAFQGGSEDSSSPKLFFAEEKEIGCITACRILDGSSTTGCGMCSNGLQHPKSRFRQGLYHPKRRDLRPRKLSLTGRRH